MMVQNEHRNGQPRPASKLAIMPYRAVDALARQHRRRRALKTRQVIEVIVDRLHLAAGSVAQQVRESALRLARKQGDAEVERLVQRLRRLGQHGEAAGDVESADADGYGRRTQRAREVHDARELVRLRAREAHEAAASFLDLAGDTVGPDAGVGLVEGKNLDVDVVAQTRHSRRHH